MSKSVEKTALDSNTITHIKFSGNDEVSSLAGKVNQMIDTINIYQSTLRNHAEILEKKVDEKTKELLEAQVKLLQSERLAIIGQMAAMVAHDLRSPLSGIKNALFYLRRNENLKDNEDVKKILGLVEENLENATKIINDLLDYSREIKLEKQNVSLKNLLSGSILETKVTSNVRVINSVDNSLEVFIDENKMKRVFVNLFNNAVDAMPNGGTIEISSSLEKNKILVTIADTGKGMSLEHQSKLWIPLFTTKTKGIGLGLVICKRFVEAHGGNISVRSEENKGTIFTIELPIIESTR